MSERIIVEKTIYSLDQFNNTIDTKFSELVQPSTTQNKTNPDLNLNEFFSQYSVLFYNIPPSGSDNSHLGLASRSLEYLGLSLEDLQNEIDILRQENTELKNQIIQVTSMKKGELGTIGQI